MANTASAEAVAAQITLLGRFEIVVDGREVALRSANERALFARLALEPGTVVPVDALIEAIWPSEPQPNDPVKSLRFHVWHLRDLLEPERPGRCDGRLVRTPTSSSMSPPTRSMRSASSAIGSASSRSATSRHAAICW